MKQRALGIGRVVVEGLFGLYNYDIPTVGKASELQKTLILYGDNGCGKTSILRLIFHLLACEPRAGHKSFIGRHKFKRLTIELTNGTVVWAERPSANSGSYQTGIRKRGKGTVSAAWKWLPEHDAVRPTSPKEERVHEGFFRQLGSLKLRLYLLSDDRRIEVSGEDEPEAARHSGMRVVRRIPWDIPPHIVAQRMREESEESQVYLLTQSLENAEHRLRKQALSDSSRGESNVNQIYSEIMKKLTTKQPKRAREAGLTREDLCERIAQIEKRNKAYSRFGLTPVLDAADLIEKVKRVPGNRLDLVRRILLGHLESLEAKLNAMEEVHSRIESLVSTINSFIVDKSINFDVSRGFVIRSRTNEVLPASVLSSGERHLLLLFCNTIAALDRRSIFIIDEPEISLNIKWQRKLITSLLSCAKNSPIQYILASHSMEILAQHMDKVVKLEHTGS